MGTKKIKTALNVLSVAVLVCCILLTFGIIDNRFNITSPANSTTEGRSTTEEPSSEYAETSSEETEPDTTADAGGTTSGNNDGEPKPPGEKTVYLTFDDGPTAGTLDVLDVLDRYGVKATFFVVYYPNTDEILKETHSRGHTVGLHSYSHNYAKIYASSSAFFEDLNKLEEHIEDVIGERPRIMRFPGGASNTVSKKYSAGIMTSLAAQVTERGYKYFDWNNDSGDALGTNRSASSIVSGVKNGVVNSNYPKYVCVLMHDSAGKRTTTEALPEIIEYFQGLGYEFGVLTPESPAFHHPINN